jgi:translocator protein
MLDVLFFNRISAVKVSTEGVLMPPMQQLPSRLQSRHQIIGLALWLMLTFAFAAVAAVASAQAADFYTGLKRPAWAPPGWLFAPVWTALYLLMAIAAWLVWRQHGFRGAATALGLYVLQLSANALWTWLFFVWHQGLFASVEIVLLWALIAGTIIAFWRLNKPAAALLLPYLAWVSFACALTFATWQLNATALG